jgi:RNA polymerase sigma factor (sigma-70 family)
MDRQDSTCWTLLRNAAAGAAEPRAEFVSRYAQVLRFYLAARWRNSTLLQDLDDALQDIFIECIREGGLLERARPDGPGGFRAFLYGAARNVALKFEAKWSRRMSREGARDVDLDDVPGREETLSRVFDRAWAKSIMREAAERQSTLAAQRGQDAVRRVELLTLRFHEAMPIREIARLWGVDAASLHHEYAQARKEFRSALCEVVAFHHPGLPGDVDRECEHLLSLFE